jgi:hypothetical protein
VKIPLSSLGTSSDPLLSEEIDDSLDTPFFRVLLEVNPFGVSTTYYSFFELFSDFLTLKDLFGAISLLPRS